MPFYNNSKFFISASISLNQSSVKTHSGKLFHKSSFHIILNKKFKNICKVKFRLINETAKVNMTIYETKCLRHYDATRLFNQDAMIVGIDVEQKKPRGNFSTIFTERLLFDIIVSVTSKPKKTTLLGWKSDSIGNITLGLITENHQILAREQLQLQSSHRKTLVTETELVEYIVQQNDNAPADISTHHDNDNGRSDKPRSTAINVNSGTIILFQLTLIALLVMFCRNYCSKAAASVSEDMLTLNSVSVANHTESLEEGLAV